MKIIRKGIENWAKHPIRFHCSRCLCTFEAENDEYIKSDIRNDYGDADYKYQIECPNCHKIITKIGCYEDN